MPAYFRFLTLLGMLVDCGGLGAQVLVQVAGLDGGPFLASILRSESDPNGWI